jgi:hypothetical protein
MFLFVTQSLIGLLPYLSAFLFLSAFPTLELASGVGIAEAVFIDYESVLEPVVFAE